VGNNGLGGDSSSVLAALVGVDMIYPNEHAFAAVLLDRTVVTWC